IDVKLNDETAAAGTATAMTKAQTSAAAQASAKRQGRLAVAMLGKSSKPAQDALPAIERPAEPWAQSLSRAREQGPRGYRELAEAAYKQAEDGRRAPLPEARKQLADAALAARQLPGSVVAVSGAIDPVAENRALQTHDLLVWQSQRMFDDYWASL